MRLVNYGAGEVVDRLSILALKLHHADEQSKPTDHFRNEQVALLAKLKAANGVASYVEALLELSVVNGRLWRAEDDIRAYRKLPYPDLPHGEVVACAFRVQTLNDRRAELVAIINQQTGEHRGEEKLND